MSVSQMLLAFVSPEPRLGSNSGGTREGGTDGVEEGLGSFASLLTSQNSVESRDALAGLPAGAGNLSLAHDGKTLPDTLELWMEGALASEPGVVTISMEELGEGELTEGAQRWLQWLDNARASLGTPDSGALPEEASGASMAGAPLNVPGTEALKSAPMDPRDALVAGIETGKGRGDGTGKALELPAEATAKDGVATRAQGADQTHNTPLQRAASVALAAEAQVLNAQKMQDPEAATPRRSNAETEALEGLSRPGASASPGQTPLSARPVTAPPQAFGVPFGQPNWGEAMVEKVMWMSSQNLRSVEIRLDPAELGPLEIHIQNRGQENQVQFLSQNASVREALESQMYRLREMFAQQGLDRVDVTVADNSQRDTSGGQAQGGAADQRGQTGGRDGVVRSEAGQSIMTTSAAAQVSSDRLVDYYA